MVRRCDVFAPRDELRRLPEQGRGSDDEHRRNPRPGGDDTPGAIDRRRRTRQRRPPQAEGVRDRAQPDSGQNILRRAGRHDDRAQHQGSSAGRHDPECDSRLQDHQHGQRATRPARHRRLRPRRPSNRRPPEPRDQVHRQEEPQVDDVVVRGVCRRREDEPGADCPAVRRRRHLPAHHQGEQRQHPRRDEIEVSEQMRRQIRRQAEDHAAEDGAAAVPRDIPHQGVGGGHVREDVRQQQQVLRGHDRGALQQRRRDDRRQRRVRMIGDGRAEGVEQIVRIKVGEARRREHVTHPPQIPDEAVVVAGAARHGIAQVNRQRPRPGDRQRGEQRQRTGMLHLNVASMCLCGLTTSTPRIWRQPSSTCRLQ